MSPNSINSPASNNISTLPPNFYTQLESNIKIGQRMTVKHMASAANMSIAAMRKALILHYGIRITFTKGRTGGIIIK